MNQTSKRMTCETDLVYGCLKTLVANGYRVYRQNNGGAGDVIMVREHNGQPLNGISDIIGWTPEGIYLAVECKWMDGVVSEDQKKFLQSVLAGGGIATVVRTIAQLRERVMTRIDFPIKRPEGKWKYFHLYQKAKQVKALGGEVPTEWLKELNLPTIPHATAEQWCKELAELN